MKKVNLTNWISHLENESKTLSEGMEKDFMNAFEWGYVNDFYKVQHKIRVLKAEDLNISVDELISKLQRAILNMLPLRSSSNEGSNTSARLRLEALKSLLDEMGWYVI